MRIKQSGAGNTELRWSEIDPMSEHKLAALQIMGNCYRDNGIANKVQA